MSNQIMDATLNLREQLKTHFGFDQFKGKQEEIGRASCRERV